MAQTWKRGRGKLGCLQPLLGTWAAETDSPMGPVRCIRTFESALNGAYIRLTAHWIFGPSDVTAPEECTDDSLKGGRGYQEEALFGAGEEGKVAFWSFTSDGKRSQGALADVSDIHTDAVGFEAQMPAGLARQAYWSDGEEGFFWVVEAKNAKGWNRFVTHHYHRA